MDGYHIFEILLSHSVAVDESSEVPTSTTIIVDIYYSVIQFGTGTTIIGLK